MLWLMWFPPVTISVVVLSVVLHIRIEYPGALLPLYLHPPSDCANMFVCGCLGVFGQACGGIRLFLGP